MTPIALSHIGIPDSPTLCVDEYPKEGLGVYDDCETCDDFTGYAWATWTAMTAHPMQIDSALQALLTPSAPVSSGQKDLKYDLGTPVNVDPDSAEDVPMDSGVDKRSRESPDSTLKPEGKLPKTSEAATTEEDSRAVEENKTETAKPSTTTKRPTTIPEAKSLTWMFIIACLHEGREAH